MFLMQWSESDAVSYYIAVLAAEAFNFRGLRDLSRISNSVREPYTIDRDN